MIGMTKKQIDKWVTDNYERMRLLATARTVTYKRNVEPVGIVSNCYEYLIKNKDILTAKNIESVAFQYINMQVIWTNSDTNKEELQTASPFYKSLQYDPRMIKAEADVISEKVKEEYIYQERKAILALYLEKVKHDKVKRRLLEVMLQHNIYQSRKVAAHFNISHTGAWILIKQLKGEIEKFKRELNKYDELNNFK